VTAKLLDGKSLARELQHEIAERVMEFVQNNAVTPTLAAVLVGTDPASEVYVRNKRRACEKVGMESRLVRLPPEISQDELMGVVAKLNRDDGVHGILVQLPLPSQIQATRILDAVHPLKDVDAFHPENVGRISQGRPRYLPCTPQGVLQLLFRNGLAVAEKRVVIIGRSDIVGKPLALLLMQRESALGEGMANATVTVCHSRTPNLPTLTREADVLIAAVGKPRFITAEMVRAGAIVVDVGINRVNEQIVGDVDFEAVKEVAGYLSPVPGGVGPLTIAMLLQNTLAAAAAQMA
jgi:methylenetetrahydrofolate dehydrogenase (NADP+)/methenyltetrahydrofolate cyclohydrolase